MLRNNGRTTALLLSLLWIFDAPLAQAFLSSYFPSQRTGCRNLLSQTQQNKLEKVSFATAFPIVTPCPDIHEDVSLPSYLTEGEPMGWIERIKMVARWVRVFMQEHSLRRVFETLKLHGTLFLFPCRLHYAARRQIKQDKFSEARLVYNTALRLGQTHSRTFLLLALLVKKLVTCMFARSTYRQFRKKQLRSHFVTILCIADHNSMLQEQRAGQPEESRRIFREGVQRHPLDASLIQVGRDSFCLAPFF